MYLAGKHQPKSAAYSVKIKLGELIVPGGKKKKKPFRQGRPLNVLGE